MRIIFVNRFFAPDQSATSQLLTDLATLLARENHAVTVIACGRTHEEPHARLPRHDTIDGVAVERVAGTMLGTGVWARLIDYLTFTASASAALWRMAKRDAIVVAKTDPPLLALPVALIVRLRGATLVNWLQDVFPEVAVEVSASRIVGACLAPVRKLRNGALRAAACNVVLGERMAARLRDEGVDPARIVIIHNWAPFGHVAPVAHEANTLRAAWSLGGDFVVGYSGNMGRAHDFETLLDAAERLREEPGIRFLLIGGGHQRAFLQQEVARRRLVNVRFLPYQPAALLAESLGAADVHLVSLAPRLEGLMVPSKFYGIAAAGRPTIFIGDARGEIPRILGEANCGATVRPGDAEALARTVLELSRDPALCRDWGARARALACNHFDRASVLRAWQGVFRRAAQGARVAPARAPRPRIAVLFQRLGPYHHARLRALAEEADVIAIEMSEIDGVYAWDAVARSSAFRQITAFPGQDADACGWLAVTSRLHQIFGEVQPDAVAIPGWGSKLAISALAACAARRTPAIVMSASTAQDYTRRNAREMVKRQVLKLSAAALAGGRAQADYLAQLGVSRDKIFLGYDVVDNAHFARGAEAARRRGDELRAELGLPRRYFLTVSRFVAKKNLPRLLEAFAIYRADAGAEARSLVMLGDGPARPSLESHVAELGLQDSVVLAGFQQYDQLPAYYGLAESFIIASLSEQWGLVVNEAMAAGLPVLVSRRCGCAPDLVEESVNGFSFDPENTREIAGLMSRVAKSDVAAMGAASRRIVDRWSPATFRAGLLGAAACARHDVPAREALQ